MKKNKVFIYWIVSILLGIVFVYILHSLISFFWGMIIVFEICSIGEGMTFGIITGIKRGKEKQRKGVIEKFASVFLGMVVGGILGIFRGVLFGVYDGVEALLCPRKSERKNDNIKRKR